MIFALALSLPAAEARENQWNLSTADTHITIGIANDQPVISRLAGPKGSHNWAGQGMPLSLMDHVWIGQHEIQIDWTFVKGVLGRRSGTLTLIFSNSHPRLILNSIWRARPGHGPVEHWLEIQNQSAERVTVSHQDSLSLQGLDVSGKTSLWWIRRGGSNASTQGGTFTEPLASGHPLVLSSNCEDGSSPVPWMAVQVGEERGLYVGWEFSGLGRIEAKAGSSLEEMEIHIGNNPEFKTEVEPGETFLIPPAFIGCYTGDIDEGSYCLHRFILEKLRPRVPKDYPDPALNSAIYLDAGGPNSKEADLLGMARWSKKLGFETFMPDALWFPATGDWRWDPRRFPQGIRPIEEYVHTHGMKMALWCAWTNGGVSSDPEALSVRGPNGHPDWFNADYPPDWQPGPFYGGQVCLACPEAKEWEIKKTQWLVSHHRLDYMKHDCGPIVNQCNKKTHRHRYGVDVSYWATMGYYEVQEKLRKAFPSLILEDCSGGGHIKDFGVIRRTHYIVTTDTLSNLPDRQSIYDSTFALPPLVLQAYTYERVYGAKGDDPGPFLWRSAMMSAWQIAPANSASWTDTERDSVKQATQIYKKWIRPILKDCKVHHILPRPDGIHWDGMFYWSARLKRGTLYIFRPDAVESEKTVKLKGLEAQKSYWVWCEDGAISPGVHTGEELMSEGLTLRLPQVYTSDLIYIQDTALGKPKGSGAAG